MGKRVAALWTVRQTYVGYKALALAMQSRAIQDTDALLGASQSLFQCKTRPTEPYGDYYLLKSKYRSTEITLLCEIMNLASHAQMLCTKAPVQCMSMNV